LISTVLGLAGCVTATPELASLIDQWPADLPSGAQISGVPFVAQEDYQCGPAALAMVAQHAGVQAELSRWVEQVFLPARQGSLQIELLAASRRNGLPAYVLAPTLSAVLREVSAGHPVLVLQNLAFSWSPVWHYSVVIGFDRVRNTVTMHSGRSADLVVSLTTFERTWARSMRWAMVALRPSQLPATALADSYVASIAALERINPGAAQTAYAAALERWPSHRVALIGAGNSAYALGQLDKAAKVYRSATLAYPQDGDAWNNLAQVLFDMGRTQEALEAVKRAVAIGGTRAHLYRKLEKEIEQR
jgi:tetratricopeptide (TPR) repeat protein